MNKTMTSYESPTAAAAPRCSVCAAESDHPQGDDQESLCRRCERLMGWFREHLSTELSVPPEAVTADALLVADLGADSLDTLEIVMQLEAEFDLQICEEDAQRFESVADAVRFVNRHAGDHLP